jgi:hypothetical protein
MNTEKIKNNNSGTKEVVAWTLFAAMMFYEVFLK